MGETTEAAPPPPPTPLELLGLAVSTLPGVVGVKILLGELIVDADRDQIPALMTTLRDDPRFVELVRPSPPPETNGVNK